MLYTVEIDETVERSLRRVPKNMVGRIRDAIDGLADDPRPRAAKALQGNLKGKLRLRVGDYRIIYSVHDNIVTVRVLDVGQRGGIYG